MDREYNSFVGSINAAARAAMEVFEKHLSERGIILTPSERLQLADDVFEACHRAADPDD